MAAINLSIKKITPPFFNKKQKPQKRYRQTKMIRSHLPSANLIHYFGNLQAPATKPPQQVVSQPVLNASSAKETVVLAPEQPEQTTPIATKDRVAQTPNAASAEATTETANPDKAEGFEAKKSDIINICRRYCQQLFEATRSENQAALQVQWQTYYDSLNASEQEMVWRYANYYLPEVKTHFNIKAVNLFWSRIFYKNNSKYLSKITKGPVKSSRRNKGLIYCYLIDGRVRYVGQTREKTLYWRMTKRQKDGQIGYNVQIKRNLINAYRAGRLTIQTKLVSIVNLDKVEQSLIKYYAPSNNLWNKENNDYFNPANYNI